MSLESQRFYEFGDFRLDRVERRLVREGTAVPLPSKSVDVLLVLVENAGRVLERSELVARVWPDSAAAEGSLAVTISTLRKTLGNRPDGGLYIETVPRQGYRFAVSVTAVGEGAGSLASSVAEPAQEAPLAEDAGAAVPGETQRASVDTDDPEFDPERGIEGRVKPSPSSNKNFKDWVATHQRVIGIAVALGLAAVAVGYAFSGFRTGGSKAQVRRLAILPFRNLKPDDQTEFLGSSLADATTTRLRGLSSLIVRPSSYVEKYRGMDVDPKKVADELNVDTLMTGTYIKEGNTLRVTVQLIDVNKGEIISRYPFETKYDKLATVQDEVAHNIIERLQLNLSPAEAEQLRQQTTEDSIAYEYYLRGMDLYSRNEFRAAVPLLEKAVERDPNFAIAWAHLGRAYTASASFNLQGRDIQLKAQAAYDQALALNRDLIEATVFMANSFTDSNRVEQAVPLLRKLLQANPNIAEARWELGYAYRFAGMLNESILECERARAIDPNVKRTSSAPNAYLYIGQYEKFLSSLPNDESAAFLVFYRGMGKYYLKRFDGAAADFDRAYEMDPQLYARIGKALSYAIRNQKAVAVEVLRDVEKETEQKGVSDAEAIYKIAQAYAALGERASALRALQRSIEAGFFCYDYFKSDPLLESIRAEPEFNGLLEMARIRHEQFRQALF